MPSGIYPRTEKHRLIFRKIAMERIRNGNPLSFKGGHHTEESKKNISIHHRRFNSEETREKMSLASKGKKKSEEHRLKAIKNLRPHKIGEWKPSEKTKQIWRLAKLGKTYEEMYGIENSNRIKNIKSLKQKNFRHNAFSKLKIGLFHQGKTGEEIYGVENFKNIREKMRKAKLGKKMSAETIEKFKINRSKQIFPLRDSSIEIKIQDFLNELKIDYVKHKYIKEIEHSFQCDIFIPFMNLIIECDGDYWHCNPIRFPIPNEWQLKQINEDEIRNKELIKKGFGLWRIWEYDIRKMDLNQFKILLESNNRILIHSLNYPKSLNTSL